MAGREGGRGIKERKTAGEVRRKQEKRKIMRCSLSRAGDPSLLHVLHYKERAERREEI